MSSSTRAPGSRSEDRDSVEIQSTSEMKLDHTLFTIQMDRQGRREEPPLFCSEENSTTKAHDKISSDLLQGETPP